MFSRASVCWLAEGRFSYILQSGAAFPDSVVSHAHGITKSSNYLVLNFDSWSVTLEAVNDVTFCSDSVKRGGAGSS
jgi:hypothetical protein